MKEYFDNKAKDWDKENYRVERAKDVATQIKKVINITKDMSVMDFGCGTGLLGFNFADIARDVYFIDESVGMLKEVNNKAQAKKLSNAFTFSMEQLDKNRKFDLIVNLMVFHHISNYEAIFSDLIAKLKESGYIIFCDLVSEDGSFHAPEIVPHNGFDIKTIKELFHKNRLEVLYSEILYSNKKIINGVEREFPVFLVVGKRE